MRNLPSAIKIYFNIGIIFISYSKIEAQISTGPTIILQQCYGGSDVDYFADAIKTYDDKILTTIISFSDDGDLSEVEYQAGWNLKFDNNLNKVSENFYSNIDCSRSFIKMEELQSGAVIFAGYGSEGCINFHGGTEILLMKTDKLGNELWSKCYGSPGDETFSDLLATEDGGFLLSGWTYGSGGDIPFHYGVSINTDAVVFKLDSIGNKQWVKVLGGSNNDAPVSNIVETETGIYQLHIGTASTDYDLSGTGEGEKKWIVVLDNTGEIIQENILDSEADIKNYAGELIKYKEGTLIINGGHASSMYYPTTPSHALSEGAVAYIDSNLEINFMKQWGGSGEDIFLKHTRNTNGDFYFLGVSTSADGDLNINYGSSDYWILSTDSNFNLRWSKTFGGSYLYGEQGGSVAFNGSILIKDNLLYCFISCIVPDTLPDYDIGCGHPSLIAGYATSDAWVVVFDLNTVEIKEEVEEKEKIKIYPNPTSGEIRIEVQDEKLFITEIEVIDLMGSSLFNKYFKEVSSFITTDLSELQSGIYFIKIYQNKNLIALEKIQKE